MDEVISIVIPVYNAEKYITKCIHSIKKQTYSKWNLILVNDGSRDTSGSIIDMHAKKDERIFVIHQENKGAVEARKTGVLSEKAQCNSYIMMCDADDELPKNSLEILYREIKNNDADMVCGNIKKLWKNIKFSPRFKSPCFQITDSRIYSHEEIIKELFVSCFGVSNFPVSLCGKMYKTEILTAAIDHKSVVRFMGEDLSVTIRILPEIKKLVVVPESVYCYRIGGGTSKVIPDMMEEFVSLYRYKKQFATKYPMPQDSDFLMRVELMNVSKTHFLQCVKSKQFDEIELREEISRVCRIEEIREASAYLEKMKKGIFPYAEMIYSKDVESIIKEVEKIIKQNRWKDLLKTILKKM